MKTELKEISATRKQIDVVIEADAVRAVYDRISDNYAKAATVPGFRPGHAPRAVVRSRFKDQIRTEVLRELLPNAVQSAITEHNIEALGEPELNLENSEGLDQLGQQPISFNVNVDVLPEIKLSNYKGLEATRQTRAVKDEDVEAVIQQLRENSASLQPVEDRGAQVGDTVTANFHGKFVNDPEAEPINVEDVDLVLGGQGVVQEMTDNLTGARTDDEKTFLVDYAPDFSAKGLAGKSVEYTVKVNAVRVKELPEIDDEWAQSLSDEIESLAELRKKVRADLETQAGDEAEGKMRSGLLRHMVDAHEVELPERLLAHQTEHRFESVVRDMVNHGIDPRNPELNWDKARENLKEQAGFELRSSLLLEAVADAEKLEVSDQDIDDEINAIADASKQTPEQVRAVLTKQGGESSIASRLRNRKALDFLVANAKVTDEEWKEEKQESEASSQKSE
ncbi:MAG TPA: trigger factor [Pyrinomonadaceae bacterium]|jgi:trigger factor|nr:trigger factor [Pyrinomonadaceae bacterium]